jgi:hypothetical protein
LAWKQIAEFFPGRSSGTLQVRYCTKLKRQNHSRQRSADSSTSVPTHSATQGYENSGRKSSRKAETDKPHIVSCICDSDDVEESIIQCKTCNTWQHSECYYPGRGPDPLVDVYHTCVNCKPRAMNSIGANGRQSKLRVEEEEVIRTTPKKHSRPKLDSNTKTQPLPNHAYASDSYEARVNLDSDDEPIMASPGQRTILNRKSETSGTSRVEKEPVSSVRCLCGFNTDPNVYYENSSREYILMRCDMCRLRQHGGCIGFFIPGDVPDCYYCEKCRPDMHTIQTHDDG